uniref:Uncharacterized protein n=1 Tax=Glossina austeni TaxID=7395 RepID=A0A1A9VW07_GLOAU
MLLKRSSLSPSRDIELKTTLINGNYRRMDMVLAENCGFVVEALKKRLHVKRQNAARKSTL